MSLNLLVFDKSQVKITEYFTDQDITLDVATSMIAQSKVESNSFKKRRHKSNRYLVVKSVNATEKLRNKPRQSNEKGQMK